MRVDVSEFDMRLTQAQFDEIINNMLVNPHVFSEIACLEGQGYGVTTLCNTCNIKFNRCVIKHLVNNLIASQTAVEQKLGASITERYEVYDELWNGEQFVMVKRGVESVGYRRSYGAATSYDISPYILTGLSATDSGSGYCLLTLDSDFVKNPAKIAVRDENGVKIETQSINGYPKKVSGDWVVALGKGGPTAPACAGTYSIQHCDYMYVDVENCATATDELLPFYPNSYQIIPMAKKPEAVDANTTRFWFHPWVLVDEAFQDSGVDLLKGEFYKLLSSIDFRCVSEVAAAAEITWLDMDDDCLVAYTADTDLAVKIKDAEKGVLLIDPAYFRCKSCNSPCSACSCNYRAPLRLKIYYKTNPTLVDLDGWIPNIKEAIAYFTAAELPVASCNCKVEEGFIAEAQKPYNKVRQTAYGDTIISPQVGTLYGQLMFLEKLKDVKKKKSLKQL